MSSVTEYERAVTSTIREVESSNHGYSISLEDGTGFMLDRSYGVLPEVGQEVTLYTHQGAFIHGVTINGEQVYYRTAEQREQDRTDRETARQEAAAAELEKNREEYERRIAALPEPLQRKIARMRSNNPDFDRDYLAYELFSLEQGQKIAAHIIATTGIETPTEPAEVELRWAALDEFGKAPWELQKDVVSSEHSGNTFGVAMNVAAMLLDRDDFALEWMHGALAGLVGCDDIGCHSPADLDMLREKYADSAAPAAVEGGQNE